MSLRNRIRKLESLAPPEPRDPFAYTEEEIRAMSDEELDRSMAQLNALVALDLGCTAEEVDAMTREQMDVIVEAEELGLSGAEALRRARALRAEVA